MSHLHMGPGHAPARKSRTGLIIVLVAAGLLAALVGCTALLSLASSGGGAPTRTPLSVPTQSSTSEEPAAADATPARYTPTPADFKIRLTILKKSCFGSAGCNVTYRIKPSYDGPVLTDEQQFDVVYQVRGAEDGPMVNTFTMTGTRAQFDAEEFVSTSSSGATLTAKVTEVISAS